MKTIKNLWYNLDIKSKFGYIFASLAFIFGFGLTIAAFCVPPVGEISDGILWILGLSLTFVGAVVGISTHYDAELKKLKDFVKRGEE